MPRSALERCDACCNMTLESCYPNGMMPPFNA